MDPLATPFEASSDYMQSLARGIQVLRMFDADHPALTLSETAERAGLARAVARRCLLTLQHLGYVGSRGRQFHLLPRVMELGFSYLNSLNLPDLALPWMERLAAKVQESCSLSVLDGQELVYVARVPVKRVMTIALGVGARLPAYAASMGRVLLAGLSDPALEARLASADLRPLTHRTLHEREALKAEILKVRGQGFAMVVEELEVGLCSVAVPVRNGDGEVAAALNIGIQAREGYREWATDTLLPALKETQAAIERTISHHWTPGVS